MRELSIGNVAQATGLSASALRYYEKAGLLPAPPRRSRQRRYDESVFGRIELIRLALDAGFTIRETRTFLSGFAADTPPAARWRALAVRKLPELEQAIELPMPLPAACGLRAISQRGATPGPAKGLSTSMR